MKRQTPKELIEKYLTEKATPDEKVMLESWYLAHAENINDMLPEPNYAQLENNMWPVIDDQTACDIRQRSDISVMNLRLKQFSRYIAYAASIALVVGLAWFAWRNTLTSTNQSKVANRIVDKHKAILILEDGTSISLNSKTKRKIKDGTAVLSDSARAINYQSANAAAGIYHTLVVPRGGEYKLLMSDGTQVWLNSETRLRYPATLGTIGSRLVYLESGEAYFKVAKNKKAPFMVNLKGMQIEVLGTSFNVSTFNQKVTTTLVEGSIIVNRNGQTAVQQKPGEQSVFDPTNQSLSKSEVDVYPYTSWKDGWLVFNDSSLGEVMEQVGRWYDYHVEFESPALKALRFGGKLRKSKSLIAILAVVERSNEVKYKISDQTIYIYSKQ